MAFFFGLLLGAVAGVGATLAASAFWSAPTREDFEYECKQLEINYALMKRRLLAAESLEELARERLLFLTSRELSKIVTDSERMSADQRFEQRLGECPHCGGKVSLKTRRSVVSCPHKGCGRDIVVAVMRVK